MRKLGAAMMVAAVLATSACGGGGRPSQSEVADGLSKSADSVLGESSPIKELPKKVSDCMAKTLTDSDLSDGALRAIADGKKDYKASADDKKALTGLTSKMTTCVTDNMDLSELGNATK